MPEYTFELDGKTYTAHSDTELSGPELAVLVGSYAKKPARQFKQPKGTNRSSPTAPFDPLAPAAKGMTAAGVERTKGPDVPVGVPEWLINIQRNGLTSRETPLITDPKVVKKAREMAKPQGAIGLRATVPKRRKEQKQQKMSPGATIAYSGGNGVTRTFTDPTAGIPGGISIPQPPSVGEAAKLGAKGGAPQRWKSTQSITSRYSDVKPDPQGFEEARAREMPLPKLWRQYIDSHNSREREAAVNEMTNRAGEVLAPGFGAQGQIASGFANQALSLPVEFQTLTDSSRPLLDQLGALANILSTMIPGADPTDLIAPAAKALKGPIAKLVTQIGLKRVLKEAETMGQAAKDLSPSVTMNTKRRIPDLSEFPQVDFNSPQAQVDDLIARLIANYPESASTRPADMSTKPKTYFHGTTFANADAIRKGGFKVGKGTGESSYLGGPQVEGVHLSGDEAHYGPGGALEQTDQLLRVESSHKNPYKLSIGELDSIGATPKARAAWLKKNGYDSIELTYGDGTSELIVLDPKMVKVSPDMSPKPGIGGQVGAKEPWQMTQKEFDSQGYFLHKDIRSKTPAERDVVSQSILQEGLRRNSTSFGNSLPAYRGGAPMDIIERKYGPKAGDRGYLIPREAVDSNNNYKAGHKPSEGEVIDFSRDYQSAREATIETALKRGKPVPPEVLADYPDLQAKYATPPDPPKPGIGGQVGAKEPITVESYAKATVEGNQALLNTPEYQQFYANNARAVDAMLLAIRKGEEGLTTNANYATKMQETIDELLGTRGDQATTQGNSPTTLELLNRSQDRNLSKAERDAAGEELARRAQGNPASHTEGTGAKVDANAAPEPPKAGFMGQRRTFMLGGNAGDRAVGVFDSASQKAWFDAFSKAKKGGGGVDSLGRPINHRHYLDSLGKQLGLSPEEAWAKGEAVYNDVRAQMKGVEPDSEVVLKDNVGVKGDAQPTPDRRAQLETEIAKLKADLKNPELWKDFGGSAVNAKFAPVLFAAKLPTYVKLGAHYLEVGIRDFSAWALKMRESVPDITEDVLKRIWEGAHARLATGVPWDTLHQSDLAPYLTPGKTPMGLFMGDRAKVGMYENPTSGVTFRMDGGPGYPFDASRVGKASWAVKGDSSAAAIFKAAASNNGLIGIYAGGRESLLGSYGAIAAHHELEAALRAGSANKRTLVEMANRVLAFNQDAWTFHPGWFKTADEVLESLVTLRGNFENRGAFVKALLNKNAIKQKVWTLPDWETVLSLMEDPRHAGAQSGDLMVLLHVTPDGKIFTPSEVGVGGHSVYPKAIPGIGLGHAEPGVNITKLAPQEFPAEGGSYSTNRYTLERKGGITDVDTNTLEQAARSDATGPRGSTAGGMGDDVQSGQGARNETRPGSSKSGGADGSHDSKQGLAKFILSDEQYAEALRTVTRTVAGSGGAGATDAFKALVKIGAHHLASGAIKFGAWSSKVLNDVPAQYREKVKPQLRAIWEAAHKEAGLEPPPAKGPKVPTAESLQKQIERLNAQIGELKAGTWKPREKGQTPPGLEDLTAQRDALRKEAAKLRGEAINPPKEPVQTAADKFGSLVTNLKLTLNPLGRVKDFSSNVTKLASEGILTPFKKAVGASLEKAGLTEGHVFQGAPWAKSSLFDEKYWATVKKNWGEIMKGADPFSEKKFSGKAGIGGKIAGMNDAMFRETYFRSHMRDWAISDILNKGEKVTDDALKARIASAPKEQVTAAQAYASRMTFNADNALGDLQLHVRQMFKDKAANDPTAAGMWLTGQALWDATTRFTRVITNVAQDKIRYTPAGVVEGIVRLGTAIKRNKGGAKLTFDEARMLSEVIAKGTVGSAGMAIGYILWKQGIGEDGNKTKWKPGKVVESDSSAYLDQGAAEQGLAGLAPAIMIGQVVAFRIERAKRSKGTSDDMSVAVAVANELARISVDSPFFNAADFKKDFDDGNVIDALENLVAQQLPTGAIAKTLDSVNNKGKFDPMGFVYDRPVVKKEFKDKLKAQIPGMRGQLKTKRKTPPKSGTQKMIDALIPKDKKAADVQKMIDDLIKSN